ncbi:MAG: heptose kinase [Pseudomonas sp.]|nr:heptose kinase [Pseudomonas sp.]
MAGWTLKLRYAALADDFGSLSAVFALEGEEITRDPMSEVIRVERAGVRYYIKRYHNAGKGIRPYLPRPRIRAEWQNLCHFVNWGIPTADMVAWGLERKMGGFVRGALITRELPGTENLWMLDHLDDSRLRDPRWVDLVSRQLADSTRRMHEHRFAHNDLKWRNLLVDDQGHLFFIDCPNGTFWCWPFLSYRIDKDLACLDKVAKRVLSRNQRLRFYLRYCGRQRLNTNDRKRIWRILGFFEGRE